MQVQNLLGGKKNEGRELYATKLKGYHLARPTCTHSIAGTYGFPHSQPLRAPVYLCVELLQYADASKLEYCLADIEYLYPITSWTSSRFFSF